ncbi:MAG: CHAT domain-containing protein [Bacteroidales bacterium]|nr:CHAT domain-containing protein [Bacteroidales bacterium]
MNNRFFLLLVVFVTFNFQLLAQLPVAFPESRVFPEDSTMLETLNQEVKNGNLDSLLITADIYAQRLLAQKNIPAYLFLMNQTSVNLIGIFRNLNLADSIQEVAMHTAIKSTDTLNIEFAMLMKFRGTNFFYQYKDQESVNYFMRGHNIMKSLKDTTRVFTDFKANVGNGLLNLGRPYEALPFMEEALAESKYFGDGLLYMIVSQGLAHIAFKTDVRLGIEIMTKVERDVKQVNLDSNMLNKFLANINYMLSGYYGKLGDKEMETALVQKSRQYINNSLVPDLYLRMNILRQNLYDAMDAGDVELQKSVMTDIEHSIKKYEIEDPLLLAPVYYTYYQSYHSRNMTEEAAMYKKMVIEAVGDKPSRERIEAYSLLMTYSEIPEEKLRYAYRTIENFLDSFNIENLKNDSLILNTIDIYNIYQTMIPSLMVIGNYYRDFAAGDAHENLEKSIKVYNLLAEVVLRSSNGVIEDASGLRYSKIYENIVNQQLRALFSLNSLENKSKTQEQIVDAIASSQSFFLQKQMAFRKRNTSEESESLWNDYFEQLLKKRHLKTKFDQSQLTDNPMSKIAYEDSAMKISTELIKLQIRMNNENLLYAPKILAYNASEIRQQLKPDEALLNYYVDGDSLWYSVLITSENIVVKSYTSFSVVKTLIAAVSRKLKSGETVLSAENQQLSKLLIGDIPNGIHRLIIIPHKDLWKIPFEILSLDGSKLLVETHSIVYHNSLNLWMESAMKKQNLTPSFAGFAPVFNGKSNDLTMRSGNVDYFAELYNAKRAELDHLPYSKLEVEKIAKLFKNNDVEALSAYGKDATEDAFRHSINKYAIIHIATHGYVSKTNPEFTGIFFAENSTKIDDAYLFSDEISNLTPKAHLIVLSSCNSGSGRIEGSEGINSLQRYFILAGVPNVMASLWKVHDQKTMLLMNDFYSYYLNGNDYATSLQKAKQEAIKRGELPLDWAGFILIGR